MSYFMQNINSIQLLDSGPGWFSVDKPSGISIHNDPGNDLSTLLLHYIELKSELCNLLKFKKDFGIHAVNRLDKLTSGVILFACDKDTFRYFSRQFEDRKVQKKYIAIIHGNISLKNKELNGFWQWPLSEKSGGRNCPQGRSHMKKCRTDYKILQYSKHYTMIECDLLTGRNHQIRRHAKIAGHPVIGDKRYGSKRSLSYLKTNCGFTRLGLHSMSLKIMEPEKLQPINISSTKIPDDMNTLFKNDLL